MATTQFVAEQQRYPVCDGRWRTAGVQEVEPPQRYISKNVYHKAAKERNQGFKGLQKTKKEKNCVFKASKRKFKRKRRVPRTVPRAPFNDSSFLMRVRRSGGLVESPVSSSSRVVTSPAFSNLGSVTYQDFLDHEDYGYGSMAGLIRLRGGEEEEESCVVNNFDDVNICGGATSGQNLEQRLGRFEMADLPAREVEVSSEDSRIRYLEDENLVLKGRLILVQQEVNELRVRLRSSDIMVRENDHGSMLSCLDS